MNREPFTYKNLRDGKRVAYTRDGEKVLILYPVVTVSPTDEMLVMKSSKETYWVQPSGRFWKTGKKLKDIFTTA